jgi:hypothetical protein
MVATLMVVIEHHMVPERAKERAKAEEEAKVKAKAREEREYIRQRKPLRKQQSSM